MIKISRPPAPQVYQEPLIRNEVERLNLEASTRSQSRVNFNTGIFSIVKGDIENMFRNKCAYCESTTHNPVNGGMENFRPRAGARTNDDFFKDHYFWLAYKWENLYLVCNVCTKYKRDFFPLVDESTRAIVGASWDEVLKEQQTLIDPCNDEPHLHLRFEENGKVIGLTDRGRGTIQILGLNRIELIEARARGISSFLMFLDESTLINYKLSDEVQGFVLDLFSDSPRQQFVGALRATYQRWERKIKEEYSVAPGNEALKTIVNIFDNAFQKAKKPSKGKSVVKDLKLFSIKHIEIVNFKNIDHLSINVLSSSEVEGQEPWLLLLGDNGIGKSAILQAIAMTLCGRKKLSRLPLKASDVLKWNTESGFVKILSYESDTPIELHFDRNQIRTSHSAPPTYLLAYGATRLLPRLGLKEKINRNKWVNISNLFDYSVALSDASKWLLAIHDEMQQERVFTALFDLLDLKKGQRLIIDNGSLHIFDGLNNNSLEAISDGYKTMIALACDIMKFLSTDVASFHSTKGIVLIDELGNHLHPRWRMKVVGALRKAFPQLQFIVSTHEPLCLRGLSHGEVSVLITDQNHKVKLIDSTLLPDHNMLRVDQLLTSDLFGLINTLDKNTEKLYEDYFSLLSIREEDKTPSDRQQIQNYVDELAGKEMLGNTPQEQIVYEIVNEVYAKSLLKEGFQTKEELKKDVIQEVKSILIAKKLDWI